VDAELTLRERQQASLLAPRLLEWFEHEGRKDLPWQHPPTAYRVWVSEIMLQQTQVATVIPYYTAFVQRFPDIASLAGAPLDDVLHLWSGLGYYARARNLQRAAQAVVARHGGQFPQTLEEVEALPGVGRSTAGAILALAFGQRHPILDGNVKRVLCRCFGVEGFPGASAVERRLWALADACTPAAAAAAYTQAIMDLGATVCTRGRPACLLCPLQGECVARQENRQDRLPESRPARKRPQREAWIVIARRGQHEVLLEQRPPSGLWGGLWVLPEFPTLAHAQQWCGEHLAGGAPPRRGETLHHAFSHFDYQMRPLLVTCQGLRPAPRDDDRYRWYDVRSPARIGVPKPIATLIRNATCQEKP
jgi:A/G-specific adenine glycosylase